MISTHSHEEFPSRELEAPGDSPAYRGDGAPTIVPVDTRNAIDDESPGGDPNPPIADRQVRLTRLEQQYQDLEQIRKERGLDPAMRDIPGGTTGLLTVVRKEIRTRAGTTTTLESKVDYQLLDRMAELLKQAAHETGEWNRPHVQKADEEVHVMLQIDRAERSMAV